MRRPPSLRSDSRPYKKGTTTDVIAELYAAFEDKRKFSRRKMINANRQAMAAAGVPLPDDAGDVIMHDEF